MMEVFRRDDFIPLTRAFSPEAGLLQSAEAADSRSSDSRSSDSGCEAEPVPGEARGQSRPRAHEVLPHLRAQMRAERARRAGVAGQAGHLARLGRLGSRAQAERSRWSGPTSLQTKRQATAPAGDETSIWVMPTTSTFLVDDSPSFLQSAARFLAADDRIEIVGVALSALDALEQIAALKPDLVLMDLNMPGMNGLEATRRLKAGPNPPRVVILTLNDTEEYRQAALQAQADGFVAKSDLGQKLLPLLESLFLNPAHLSSEPATTPAPGTAPTGVAPEALDDSTRAAASPETSPETSLEASPPALGMTGLEVASLTAPSLLSCGSLGLRDALSASALARPPLHDARTSLPQPPQAAGETGASTSARPRVLLAQDQATASHLMAVNLWRAGIEARIAPNAPLALELFETFDPHLVLLDSCSPHIRADLICHEIRERSDVPILLLTSRAGNGTELGLASGREMVNIEEAPCGPEDIHRLTARVLALLDRFYPDA